MIINDIVGLTRQFLATAGSTFGGKRDLYEIFGYKKKITSEDHRFRYQRGDIAGRLVDAYPSACWAQPPAPTDDGDTQEDTPWEKKFKQVAKDLKLWQVVRKADILAQLNQYSIILFGLKDSMELSEPVAGKKPIAYIRAFGSDTACVETWVNDQTDPRFGKPETYKIEVSTGRSLNTKQDVIVHHTRVLHMAERTLDDPVYGIPFLDSVWNRLDDVEKVAGSSGEIWWLNGRGGLQLDVDKDAELDDETKDGLKTMADEYQHKLSRMLRTKGVDVKPIQMEIESPKDHIDIYLSLISGATGIPKRILMGSERGELASSQDENNFDSRVRERRDNFCEPDILEPLMEKLIALGAIVDTEFEWVWPELTSLSDKDAAEVASKKASAIAAYANSPTSDSIISHRQFVEDVLNMEYREDELDAMLREEDEEIEASEIDNE